MNNNEKTLPLQDPEMDELLKLLQETPERDPRVVEQGRARYIAEVNEMFTSSSPNSSWLEKVMMIGIFRQNRENNSMSRTMKLSYSIALVALLLIFFLFSGAGITAYAAQSALPGDALYSLKTSIEQAQVRLAADAAKIAELHLEFAERRLVEISGLIAEGRYGDIDRATQEFEYHVQQALQAMETVAAGDPLRAQQLAARVTAALSEYARSLAGMMLNVPEGTRASMQRAIDTSQSGGVITPGEFGENENEATNDNINDDQADIDGVDNINGNNADDDRSNQNENLINDNEDDDDNINTNLNSNRDDDGNENSNSNLNDQHNDNQNDSGDDNTNSNSNDDGDDNDNDRDNDNHNDNDGDDDKGDDD